MGVIREYLGAFSRKKILPSDLLETRLHRCLGVSGLVYIGLAYAIGSGIYVLTGQVIREHAGAATIVSYVISGVAALLSALSYAEFGGIVPLAGSSYTFTYIVVGECSAFLVGWNMVLEYVLAVTTSVKTASATINSFTNGTLNELIRNHTWTFPVEWLSQPPDFISVLITLLCAVFAVIGIRSMQVVNKFLLAINLGTLGVIIVAGFVLADVSNWVDPGFAPYGVNGVFSGAALCFFAYVGFDAIAVASEEAINPRKDIPTAIMITIGILVLLYSVTAMSLTLVVPYDVIDPSSPFASAFAIRHQPWIQYLVGAGSVVSLFVSTIVAIFIFSHLLYSIASDGLLPAFLSHVNTRTRTPVNSVLVCTILSCLISFCFDLAILVDLFSIGTLFSFIFVSACVILIRYRPVSDDHTNKMSDTTELTTLTHKHDTPGSRESHPHVPYRSQQENIILASLCIMIFSMTVLLLTVSRAYDQITAATWWALLVLLISVAGSIFPVFIIWSFDQNPPTGAFQVPGVPFVPSLGILCNIGLMVMLDWLTWIRLAVWVTLGLAVYVGYGMRHSKLRTGNYDTMRNDNQYEDLDQGKTR